MNKLKVYLDTSIINFLYADDAVDYKDITEDFFKKQMQINSINKLEGYYKELNLFNPMEVMYEK